MKTALQELPETLLPFAGRGVAVQDREHRRHGLAVKTELLYGVYEAARRQRES